MVFKIFKNIKKKRALLYRICEKGDYINFSEESTPVQMIIIDSENKRMRKAIEKHNIELGKKYLNK